MRLRLVVVSALLACAISASAQTGRVSAGNSTTATLGIGATFTGAWEDATQAAVVVVTIKADQISAASGVKIQFSSDCSNLDYVSTASFTDTANGATVAVATAAKCARVVYVNGASGQGTFRLQTIFRDAGYGGSAAGGPSSAVTIWDNTDTAQVTTTAGGSLQVECTSGCGGSGGTSNADGAAYVAGTTSGTPVIGARDDAAVGTVAEDKLGIARITTMRGLHVNLRDVAGVEALVPGTGATHLGKAQGAAYAGSDTGVMALGVVNELAVITAVEGQYAPLAVNIWGQLIVAGSTIASDGLGNPIGHTTDSAFLNPQAGVGALAVQKAVPVNISGSDGDYELLQMSAGRLWVDASGKTLTVGTHAVTGSGVFHVDDNGGSLTVDGTVTTTPPSNATTNVTQFGGTNLSTGTGASGAGIPRVTIANDSALAANQSVNLAQLAGTTTDTNSGTKSAGTLRVVLATDQPALTNKLLVTPDSVALPANQSVNVAQFGGAAAVTGTGTGGAGIPRVTVSSDSTVTANAGTGTFTVAGAKTNNNAAPGATNIGTLSALANAAAPSYTEGNQVTLSTDLAGALRVSGSAGGGVAQNQVRNALNTWTDVGYYAGNAQTPTSDAYVLQLLQQLLALQKQAGYVKGTFGRPVASTADALNVYQINLGDPCQGANKGNVAISQTATARLVPGQDGKRIFVCYARVVAAVAEIVSFTEGTGTTCGTGTKAVSGSTTAANGESYAANGGASAGMGLGTIAVTANPGSDLCLAQSTSSRVAGNITFVYQ